MVWLCVSGQGGVNTESTLTHLAVVNNDLLSSCCRLALC